MTVWITTNWKILKKMGIPDHLTCLLRRLYACQEARVRNRYGTMDGLKIGKGDYIMGNARLNESQYGIKIARRNSNNLRYAYDTTLMAETEEELKSLIFFLRASWWRWKRRVEKAGLTLNIQKTKIMAIWPHSVQFSSVAQSCPTLCDPMNRSMPGLPVHHELPEFTQTHVHRVSDAIQPSHPLSSPSPPAPNPSQHQSLFQWVNSSHEVAKVLGFQL